MRIYVVLGKPHFDLFRLVLLEQLGFGKPLLLPNVCFHYRLVSVCRASAQRQPGLPRRLTSITADDQEGFSKSCMFQL